MGVGNPGLMPLPGSFGHFHSQAVRWESQWRPPLRVVVRITYEKCLPQDLALNTGSVLLLNVELGQINIIWKGSCHYCNLIL